MRLPNLKVPQLLLLTTALALSAKAAMTLPEVTSIAFSENVVIDQGSATFALATDAEESSSHDEPEEGADVEAQQCDAGSVPEELLLAIETEREILSKQKQEARDKTAEAELAMDKVEIETRKLQELKGEITALLDKVQAAQTADLARLVSVYSGMKPAEAAAIMNTLDIEVTVMVLGQMQERKVAPIIAKMNPVRAQAISKIIYERSQLPGDQDLNGIRLQ